MDAKPDELVIALGSSHVARILEHLHDHALNTDVDFEDVVPGLSGETCMKVWEKLKAEASASPVTIKTQWPSTEAVLAGSERNTSQVLDSSPSSSIGIQESEHDDDSGTTIPRPRALVYDTDDSEAGDAGEGEGEHESNIHSMRSPSPFLAESDDEDLSVQIVRKARAAFAEHAAKGSTISQTASQSTAPKTGLAADKGAMQTPVMAKIQHFDWAPSSLQPHVSATKQASKRAINEGREGVGSASHPAPVAKRPKTVSARLASTSKLKSTSGCKHNICLGLDKCLVTSSPTV